MHQKNDRSSPNNMSSGMKDRKQIISSNSQNLKGNSRMSQMTASGTSIRVSDNGKQPTMAQNQRGYSPSKPLWK